MLVARQLFQNFDAAITGLTVDHPGLGFKGREVKVKVTAFE